MRWVSDGRQMGLGLILDSEACVMVSQHNRVAEPQRVTASCWPMMAGREEAAKHGSLSGHAAAANREKGNL